MNATVTCPFLKVLRWACHPGLLTMSMQNFKPKELGQNMRQDHPHLRSKYDTGSSFGTDSFSTSSLTSINQWMLTTFPQENKSQRLRWLDRKYTNESSAEEGVQIFEDMKTGSSKLSRPSSRLQPWFCSLQNLDQIPSSTVSLHVRLRAWHSRTALSVHRLDLKFEENCLSLRRSCPLQNNTLSSGWDWWPKSVHAYMYGCTTQRERTRKWLPTLWTQ